MATNIIESHGKVTEWKVTESGYREAERNERSCCDKRNGESHSNASNTTQDTTDVTAASVQQTNKTKWEGDTRRSKSLKSHNEQHGGIRRETRDAYSAMCNLHSESGGGERGTASVVPGPGVQKKCTQLCGPK